MTIEQSIIGSKVTSAKDLTVGRWYVVGVCPEKYLVHAKYLGLCGLGNKKHKFEVIEEDQHFCNRHIFRSDED